MIHRCTIDAIGPDPLSSVVTKRIDYAKEEQVMDEIIETKQLQIELITIYERNKNR